MVIAVNARFLNGPLEGFGYYTRELFSRMAKQQPLHRFILVYDRPVSNDFSWPSNVSHLVVGPPARHPLLWKLWYDLRLPRRLKRSGADVFVSPDGFCSLKSTIPQVITLHDLDFLHHPAFNRKSHIYYYRRFIPKCIRKASRLVTVSNFSKNDIESNYPEARGKVTVIYNGVREGFQPLDFDQKVLTREKYTGGSEYFLYAGSIHPRKNLVNLLKAFSLFKKRQRSSMKLVIAGRQAWMARGFLESIRTYKYRSDLVLTGYLDEKELAKLMASAYAFVYPSLLEGFGMPVLEAMASAVPVITADNSAMQEVCGENALYADVTDPASLAAQLMHIYKDEDLRHRLGRTGVELARGFQWDRAAAAYWQCILDAAGANP